MVLGDADSRGGFFATITNWIRNLFGSNSQSQQQIITSQDTQINTQQEAAATASKKQLQLGTFTMGKVIEKVCPTVKFRFQ
ncbi:MAG TPA: hypothetical protein PLD54_02310, partial [Candidatus Levybacteria bacterium]|nr:hypothetical protein [Candidatus Levybacteria bacterium]